MTFSNLLFKYRPVHCRVVLAEAQDVSKSYRLW